MAILFGIEAPLCALACVDAGDPQRATLTYQTSSQTSPDTTSESSSASGQGHRPQAACHDTPSGSAPSNTPESHPDCGCDFVVEGLLSDSPIEAANFVMGLPSSSAFVDFLAAEDREASKSTFASDIPPPDILLLKSTLLI
jgi:hypothetical protein